MTDSPPDSALRSGRLDVSVGSGIACWNWRTCFSEAAFLPLAYVRARPPPRRRKSLLEIEKKPPRSTAYGPANGDFLIGAGVCGRHGQALQNRPVVKNVTATPCTNCGRFAGTLVGDHRLTSAHFRCRESRGHSCPLSPSLDGPLNLPCLVSHQACHFFERGLFERRVAGGLEKVEPTRQLRFEESLAQRRHVCAIF